MLNSPRPFSLVETGLNDEVSLKRAAEDCGVAIGDLVDMYPCTPLQEGLVALSIKEPKCYIGQFVFSVSDDLDLDRFVQS